MNHAIETARLAILPVTTRHVAAFFRSRAELASLLGVAVPGDWPVCPESMEYWRDKADRLEKEADWANYFYIHKRDGKVVGDGGFKGPPNAEGVVEMGYALIPEYRRLGLATEGAKALMDWAFGHPEVNYVTAETLPGGQDSMRVLEKLGLAFQGTGFDPDEGKVYLWRISRAGYSAPRAPAESDGCPF